jgi:protein subunit release factor B
LPNFPVSPDKWNTLEARLLKLGIREQDLDEHFVRAGGPGGQHVNKVSTCVVLSHRPSGLAVRCQEERSQGLNRYRARVRLADKMEEMQLGAASTRRQEIEKIRRQKRKRSKRAKEKMLEAKHHRAEIKASRKAAGPSEDGGYD